MRRTFIYKRTHEGDPDENGCFGICDCMGKLRNLNYEAVIGIGGTGRIAKKNGIAGRLTWIGIGPRRTTAPSKSGDLVRFDKFLYLGSNGPEFQIKAPLLAKRMYSKNAPRFLFDAFSLQEQAEIRRVLTLAEKNPSSQRTEAPVKTRTQSRCDVSRPSHVGRRTRRCT